jgi:hypothetical protein
VVLYWSTSICVFEERKAGRSSEGGCMHRLMGPATLQQRHQLLCPQMPDQPAAAGTVGPSLCAPADSASCLPGPARTAPGCKPPAAAGPGPAPRRWRGAVPPGARG